MVIYFQVSIFFPRILVQHVDSVRTAKITKFVPSILDNIYFFKKMYQEV